VILGPEFSLKGSGRLQFVTPQNNTAARSTSVYESMMTGRISLTALYEWNAIWRFE